LACRVHTRLQPLQMATCTLREPMTLASDGRCLLHEDVTRDINSLCSVMSETSLHPPENKWILRTLRPTASSRASRSDSSSDHSIERTHPRRRDEPSSGRGDSKRATRRLTSDSDSATPPPRRTGNKKASRQVSHRIFHASDRDGSDSPPFPPRIARRRARSIQTQTPCDSAASVDSLPSMVQLTDAITAVTIATTERYLATLGLLPRPANASEVETHVAPSVTTATLPPAPVSPRATNAVATPVAPSVAPSVTSVVPPPIAPRVAPSVTIVVPPL